MPNEFWLFLASALGTIGIWLFVRRPPASPPAVDLSKVDQAKQRQEQANQKADDDRRKALEDIDAKQSDRVQGLLRDQNERSGIVLKQLANAPPDVDSNPTLDQQNDWLKEQGKRIRGDEP